MRVTRAAIVLAGGDPVEPTLRRLLCDEAVVVDAARLGVFEVAPGEEPVRRPDEDESPRDAGVVRLGGEEVAPWTSPGVVFAVGRGLAGRG